MNNYTLEENLLIKSLINHRRLQLQTDRDAMKKASHLSERQENKISRELEELRDLELSNRRNRL